MGAKKQGRATRRQARTAVSELTLLLGSVEQDPVASLRRLADPLARLSMTVSLFDHSSNPDRAELLPLRSVETQLAPLQVMVSQPNVMAPPFSPDVRQRISYCLAVLESMHRRLHQSQAPLSSKRLLRTGNIAFAEFVDAWRVFRRAPTFDRLVSLGDNCEHLEIFYWSLGIPSSEPRSKNHRHLCGLLSKARTRGEAVNEVPALLREISTSANHLARPTLAEHRQWLAANLS